MNQRKPAGVRHHYLDSGPLFCLGGSPVLAELFDAHHLTNSKVVEAVVGEVVRNAILILPPVGPHPKRHLRQAAKNARGRYKALLADAMPTPSPAPDLLASIKADLRLRGAAKLRQGESMHPAAHEGEAESIFAAATESAAIVTNDTDAHAVARTNKVRSVTFVGVARSLVRLQRDVSRRVIFNELMALGRRDIFPGEHITSELDL